MTLQVEFAATLVDEWIRAGVRQAVVAPGSRSSALALALLERSEMTVYMRLDERSAAFFALGLGLGSCYPAVIVTTSGTAAAEVHAAVMEADLARVPIIVCTADRPPELHRVGAPQTIEQVAMFGGAVRFATAPGVAEEATRPYWRSAASRLVAEATSGPAGPGPVHANLAFREPFIGTVEVIPAPRQTGDTWHRVVRGRSASREAIDALYEQVRDVERGCFVVGGNLLIDGAAVSDLARRLGWPVLGDGRALRRVVSDVVVAHADQILRSSRAASTLAPELVVHVGSPHASKTLSQWCEAIALTGVRQVLIDPYASFEDPERLADVVLAADPGALCTAVAARLDRAARRADRGWLAQWQRAERAAAVELADQFDNSTAITEPGIARRIVRRLPADSTLVCSSSMPVRDVEWFAAPRDGAPQVISNRGANGIDGVISTIMGVAASVAARRDDEVAESDPSRLGGPVVGLVGDLAFFHDLSGLVWGLLEQPPPVTIVVVDNAGGGIFSFLSYPGVVARDVFERGFGTPQSSSVAEVARALGCRVTEIDDLDAFDAAFEVAVSRSGIDVLVVTTDREANVVHHAEVAERVVNAVDEVLSRLD